MFSAMSQNMNKRMFQSLYDIKWSGIGSNRRAEEEDSIYCWKIFLQDIDGIYILHDFYFSPIEANLQFQINVQCF